MTSIKSAEATNARVYLAGVQYSFGRWLVNGSTKGLVALTIEPPAEAKAWRMSVTSGTLVVSVTDRDAFVADCAAK